MAPGSFVRDLGISVTRYRKTGAGEELAKPRVVEPGLKRSVGGQERGRKKMGEGWEKVGRRLGEEGETERRRDGRRSGEKQKGRPHAQMLGPGAGKFVVGHRRLELQTN